MNSHRASRRFATRQKGAVLVVSLLLLLVMTLLGLGASQSTRLQERMAGNQRDQEIALQGAEASLRAAERVLSPATEVLTRCREPAAGCNTYEKRILVDTAELELDLANQSNDWWTEWGKRYGNREALGSVKNDPDYVIEHKAEVREVLSVGDSNLDTVRDFYMATARSSGMTDTAQVVIQSSYARIEFE
ncbi:PilX N-terminal domain-containing pilus assembly protein [Steroidobacter flavus]|uniref:PilX N-terminal domain-containing pilus assembly protein n=1 Tax=Steroidobacter flavus TaxID=1842136 RepID=A0ABV8SWX8_9GAMM